MLGSRAARLTDPNNARESRQPKPRTEHLSSTRNLNTEQRLRCWFRLTRKLQMILDAFHYKTCVMHAIGERPYKVIFGHLREEQRKTDLEQESLGIMKVLDGQIMGAVLPDSQTIKTTERGRTSKMLCQHPTTSIKQGANKHAQWFTCLDCTMRWKRTPIPNQEGPPQGSDLLLFGRFASETYHQVLTNQTQYALWVLQTAQESQQTSRQLLRFAQYIHLAREAAPATSSTTPINEEGFEHIGQSWENTAEDETFGRMQVDDRL